MRNWKFFGMNLLLALKLQNINGGKINDHCELKYLSLLHPRFEHVVDTPFQGN